LLRVLIIFSRGMLKTRCGGINVSPFELGLGLRELLQSLINFTVKALGSLITFGMLLDMPYQLRL